MREKHTFRPGSMKSRIFHFLRQRRGRAFTMWEVACCIGAGPESVSARMHELFLDSKISAMEARTKKGGVLYLII
jgi:chemotaxis methyl-accepting protein methylase